jgi:hypothetical protein
MEATAAATAPNLASIEEEARRDDVTHVLPMSRYIPLTDNLPMVDGKLVTSAAFSSRDVANVPQGERFLAKDDPRRSND